nr:zinc finger, CCHC-type [Tanacetum cinerariifolium]
MVKRMASMNTRLNIKKLDGNIVQKHGGSKQVGLKQLGSKQGFKQLGVKQVGFKQLGPGVETGVHKVSNDDSAVAQRRLEDKQPGEKTNTDWLVKEQEKEYQTGWKIKTGNVLDSCNQREDINEAAFAVATVKKIYAHESLTFNNTVASTVTGNAVTTAMAVTRSIHQTMLEGHSILSLEGSLSGDCDVEKNGKWSCIYAVRSQEYQMVCTILDITSTDVGMVDKFDHGLQTDVQFFVDFDHAMRRSITVMSR